jgi:hypothetical protein
METWHKYWGSTSQDAEWLYISFIDNAADSQNMNMWVDMCMMLCNFPIPPIHEGGEQRHPKIGTWRYLGVEPALKERMRADETHCYMGDREGPERLCNGGGHVCRSRPEEKFRVEDYHIVQDSLF